MKPHTAFGKGTGALREKRDPRNYQHSEVYGVAKAAIWKQKSPDQWKKYGDVRDQYTSGSCVGQALALMLGIENLREEGKFYHFSARPVYARNFVPPDGGMYPSVGFNYVASVGLPFEIQMRSQLIDEMSMRLLNDEAAGDRFVSTIFRGGVFLEIDPRNMDAIANVLDQNKGVGISIRFNGDLNPNGGKPLAVNGKYGHEIVITDYTLYNGKKAYVYQNSWGPSWGFKGLGVITEDQMHGIDSAFYFADFKNALNSEMQEKPKYTFTKTMKMGTNNQEVAQLQRCLGYLKDDQGYLFPLVQAPTGYYGGLTRDAVQRFQKLYNIPVNGLVDATTLAKLNEVFK